MTLFVDTSVWSLTLRRDVPKDSPEVRAFTRAIEQQEAVVATGLILQELLQGFAGPKARDLILDRFSAFPLIVPTRDDHIRAAELRNMCRRKGVQTSTVDALLAQLCISHELIMLTADQDFRHIARHAPLRLWNQPQ